MAASFFDASDDCVKILSLTGDVLAMNANGICLLEIDDFEPMRGRPWVEMWPQPAQATVRAAIVGAGKGGGVKFAADCPTAKGTPKSWEVVVWPVLGEQGEPVELMSISRDVTETRRLEEQRALLTRELSHRITNIFAIVDGLIALSVKSNAEAKSFAGALRERLSALGRAISYAAPPESGGLPDGKLSLRGLLAVLLSPYGVIVGPDPQISLSGDDAPLGVEATTTVALIFNELATNAVKYGGLSGDGGRVEITLEALGDQLRIAWRETAPDTGQAGDASPGRQPGFGSELLDRAVTRQLAGDFVRELTAGGLSVVMTLPLARLAA